MPVLTCACGQSVRVPNETAGQRFKCPKCGQLLQAEVAPAAPTPVVTPAVASGQPAVSREPALETEPEHLGPPKTSGLAVTSLVLALIGVLCLPLGLIAIILGIVALVGISNSGGKLGGKGLAIASIIIPVVALILAVPILLLLPAVQRVRGAADRMKSANNLKQIGIAMHHYHVDQNRFPPAAVTSQKDGRPLLSWRVALLPYLEEDRLYKQFRLDEPWDSPNNLPLLAQMPDVYKTPGDKDDGTHSTRYQVFVGRGTIFEENTKVSIAAVTDGTSQTILAVEAAEKVPWTKPQDLPFDANRPLPQFHSRRGSGFLVLMADGSVRTFREDFDERNMRLAITRNDGQLVDDSVLEK